MSWLITPGWSPADADAAAYITAVETADNQALENGVKVAIDNFVLGCKADGIWNAIKASCILAGARTRLGALTPLVGTAPTSVNFVSGDYNRKTGLVGDGSTKYLNSGRNNNSDPQDNFHMSFFASSASTGTSVYMGVGPATSESGASNLGRSGVTTFARNRSATALAPAVAAIPLNFGGTSRATSVTATLRVAGITNVLSPYNSQVPRDEIISIFASGSGATFKSNARLAFYSIGESLDLALLDARVTDLINAFAAAIP
jgi:hypothetical protein